MLDATVAKMMFHLSQAMYFWHKTHLWKDSAFEATDFDIARFLIRLFFLELQFDLFIFDFRFIHSNLSCKKTWKIIIYTGSKNYLPCTDQQI